MEFSRLEYCSSLSLLQRVLLNPGIEPRFPTLQEDFFTVAGNAEGYQFRDDFRSFAKGLVIALSFLDSVNYLCTLKTISPRNAIPGQVSQRNATFLDAAGRIK